MKYHESHDFSCTIGLFQASNPKECGIVDLDEKMTIIDFVEKPINPKSNLANAGIYAFNTDIFDKIDNKNKSEVLDIAFDLIPSLIGKMKGFIIKDYIIDIGTNENYIKANDYTHNNSDLFCLIN